MSDVPTVLADADELARTVAQRLLEVLLTAQAAGAVPQIGLTGGTIADAVHREVARLAVGSGVDWSRVEVWWGDERFVPADSPERNAGQARAAWLDRVPLEPDRVHEIPALDQVADVHAAAAAYSSAVRAHGGGEFDVLMLGVGPDGHVASLFPGFPQLEVRDEVAVAVTGAPKPPPERVSLTFDALNRARRVWFLVSGAEKAPAVARALRETSLPAAETSLPADEASLPAARVRGREETVWYVDAAAASLIG